MWRIRKKLRAWREKLDAALDRIPRKRQVAVNLICIVVCLFLLYIFVDAPTFTLEWAYRRAERRNLVGPGTILGIEELDCMWDDTIVIAETGEGVILFTKKHDENTPVNTLVYRERESDVMVCGTPQWLSSIFPPEGDDLTLVIFDDYPEAVRAELDIELYWQDAQSQKEYRYRYSLDGSRKNPGYFRLDLDYQWKEESGLTEHPENQTIRQFAFRCQDPSYRAPKGEYPATVRFYGEDGTLLLTRELFLFPQEGESDPG